MGIIGSIAPGSITTAEDVMTTIDLLFRDLLRDIGHPGSQGPRDLEWTIRETAWTEEKTFHIVVQDLEDYQRRILARYPEDLADQTTADDDQEEQEDDDQADDEDQD